MVRSTPQNVERTFYYRSQLLYLFQQFFAIVTFAVAHVLHVVVSKIQTQHKKLSVSYLVLMLVLL